MPSVIEHDVPKGIRTKCVSLINAITENSFQRDPLRTVLKRSVRDRGRTGKWGACKGAKGPLGTPYQWNRNKFFADPIRNNQELMQNRCRLSVAA